MPEFTGQQPDPAHRDQDDRRPHRKFCLQAPGRSPAIPARDAAVGGSCFSAQDAQPPMIASAPTSTESDRPGDLRDTGEPIEQVEPGVQKAACVEGVERGVARRHDPDTPVNRINAGALDMSMKMTVRDRICKWQVLAKRARADGQPIRSETRRPSGRTVRTG
jgi:hypothetical protein